MRKEEEVRYRETEREKRLRKGDEKTWRKKATEIKEETLFSPSYCNTRAI